MLLQDDPKKITVANPHLFYVWCAPTVVSLLTAIT